MRPLFSLDEMVRAGSVTEEGAGLLRTIGAEGHSFIVYSLPRSAGKSTLVEAILAEAAGHPRTEFLGTEEEVGRLSVLPNKGYLVVAEMGHRGRPGYLAQEEVVRAFRLARDGFSLATSLHADTLEGALDVLARNGVTGSEVAAVRYWVKVQPLGDPQDPTTPRVIEAIDVLAPVAGLPRATNLYRQGRLIPSD